MGVQGLWKLLETTGKPIPVEKLENKILSIDVSIWMYQIIKGVQESDHGGTNRHLIVMFHRICKLLFYGIKPIFVFDGGVPELKRLTIAQRQAQKSRAKKSSGRIKEKILKNMLEQAAIKTVMNTKNNPNEDEVISKTVNSLNKVTETDLFELPKLSETFELDKTMSPDKNKEQAYLNKNNKSNENILLLAVENQDDDFPFTNSAVDKKKSSPAKLNAFSSLQIGELLNGFANDQKRLSEKKKQQKLKHKMTLNELEMFLNDDNKTNNTIDEYGQKINSDCDTVFYYESDINKAAKNCSSKIDDMSSNMRTSNEEKKVETESKNANKKFLVTDNIGSPTLTEDIDEDLFKALAGDESLEEDRLAWLIFNENKKASKRRSSEFEIPTIKCSKSETNISISECAEIIKSDKEDDSTKFNKTDYTQHFSKSLCSIEDDLSNEISFDNLNDKDYISSASNSKGESSRIKIRNNEFCVDYQNTPSTSKSISFIENDFLSDSESVTDQQNIYNSLYFVSNTNETGEYDGLSNTSPSVESHNVNGSFSENSLDFSSEENLSNDVPVDDMLTISLDTENKEEKELEVQGSKMELSHSITSKTEFKSNSSNKNKLKSPIQLSENSTKQPEHLDNSISLMDEEYLLSIQNTLIKDQNDLASIHKTTDRMASSVTQKITSDIKSLLRLFGIPYITAPMEAEAQCAFLESIGCTEGTVTDDSDVWLFGANVVYKNFFDNQKYVKQFKSIDIEQKFGLSQNSFIQLAFLVGSDYTNGIDGIGPVSAIEILSFFDSKTKNMNIEDKLLKIKNTVNSKSEVYSDIPFMKKLRSSKIGSDFPNKAVINAYLNPIVNESNEKFKWGTVQEDSIIQFAQTNFDWNLSKTKSTLAPVLKKVSERTKQKSIDSYMKILPKLSNTSTGMSKRVSLAVKRLRNDNSSGTTTNQKTTSPMKSKSTDTKRKKILK